MSSSLTQLERAVIALARNDPASSLKRPGRTVRWLRGSSFAPLPLANPRLEALSDQEALQFSTEARTATALLAGKRLELRYTAILAPDDGVISARTATLGAVVPAGQELFRMIRKNRLEWRGELTAPQLRDVAKGQRIALRLPDGSDASAVVLRTARPRSCCWCRRSAASRQTSGRRWFRHGC